MLLFLGKIPVIACGASCFGMRAVSPELKDKAGSKALTFGSGNVPAVCKSVIESLQASRSAVGDHPGTASSTCSGGQAVEVANLVAEGAQANAVKLRNQRRSTRHGRNKGSKEDLNWD